MPDIDFGPSSALVFNEYGAALAFSLAASIVVYVLYSFTYGNQLGAGVNRTFLLAGPAITTLFIAIQFSLPLSLGLLGALSFVRFRTPVKDPAEIGYLLLLIASSICSATYNYELAGFLLLLTVVALLLQKGGSRIMPSRQGRNMIITVSGDNYGAIEDRLLAFLREELHGLATESHTVADGRASLHLRFRRSNSGDAWGQFTSRLNERIAPARAELYVA